MQLRFPGSLAFAPVLVATVLGFSVTAGGQAPAPRPPASPAPAPNPAPAPDPLAGLTFRNIGPSTMGGRIDDLAVLESNPAVFYVGSATGGLWRTTNNGTTWDVLFDDLDDVVSIGDIAIAPNDANTVWVGSGENNNRQSTSWGNGVYKSTDAGQTWKHMGLAASRSIARVIVDPVDHDVVYVAALGSVFGPGRERGVYKTTDGGLTWANILFVNEDTGATELVMDPSNNKVLYAATYQRRRATWGFNGGGPGSAIHKSSDGGRTWTKLTNGIPEGPLGRIGLDVYRANPNIVYARVEHAKESGVYRSDNAGQTWRKMSNTNPRPMYFSQIRIDPTNDLRIYVLGVQLHISDDGGKTFIENGVMHSDHHAMWINPANPNHILDGNDGGVGISYDKGANWEAFTNMDLGQFYHVGLRHADAVSRLRRAAGQLHVVRSEPGAQPHRHRHRRMALRPGRRRLRGADGSARRTHRLCRIAGRQHRPHRSADQRAQVDPPAGGEGRAAAAMELEHADRAVRRTIRTRCT